MHATSEMIHSDVFVVFYNIVIPESIDGGFNRTEYVRLLRELIFGILEGEDEYRSEQVYQAIHHQYTNWPHIDDLEGNRESFVKVRYPFYGNGFCMR